MIWWGSAIVQCRCATRTLNQSRFEAFLARLRRESQSGNWVAAGELPGSRRNTQGLSGQLVTQSHEEGAWLSRASGSALELIPCSVACGLEYGRPEVALMVGRKTILGHDRPRSQILVLVAGRTVLRPVKRATLIRIGVLGKAGPVIHHRLCKFLLGSTQ